MSAALQLPIQVMQLFWTEGLLVFVYTQPAGSFHYILHQLIVNRQGQSSQVWA